MHNYKSIRSGMGLGDSLYLQSVCRYFVHKGKHLKIASAWPDVFRPLGNKVQVIPFTRAGIDILAHYSSRKGIHGSTQFEDCCINAGILEPVEFKLDWQPINHNLIDSLKKHGKPIVLVQMPRNPMGRTDGFGKEIMPRFEVLQSILDLLKKRVLIVQVGAGSPIYSLSGIDIDLANKTSVTDLLDIASAADGFLGYCSFFVPLAESFGKPALFVWSSKSLRMVDTFISRITPQKILHAQTSHFVMDNWEPAEIAKAANDFLR